VLSGHSVTKVMGGVLSDRLTYILHHIKTGRMK